MLEQLKKLRRQWRTEATRRKKSADDAAKRGGSTSFIERNYGEMNVLELCANEIDEIIRAKEGKG